MHLTRSDKPLITVAVCVLQRSSRSGLPALDHPAAAAAAGALPKVALLFLTRGPMPMEPIWRCFLGDGAAWQRLFSLYAHPPPAFSYPAASLFAGREVAGRVEVAWGQHSVVEAERRLLQAALGDPQNQWFVLLSEDAVPLYSAAQAYAQLASERRSRVDACANASDPGDAQRRAVNRWQPAMAAAGLPRGGWRKSSQWVMLIRAHAELLAAERRVNEAFAAECWATPEGVQPVERFCVSDEHYIPSLLAVRGLEGECACDGASTHVAWPGPYFHPKKYGAEDASERTLREELRHGGECDWSSLEAGARRAVEELAAGRAAGEGGGAAGALRAAGVRPMPPRCPLFARKMAPEAAGSWARVLEPVLAAGRRKKE
jgi:hypothetical protein